MPITRSRISAASRQLALFCLLIALSSAAARAQSQMVTLPDNGVFSLWVRSDKGPLVTLPYTSRGRGTVSLRIASEPDQTLFVLDAKTGRLASTPVHIGSDGNGSPIALLVSDFQLLSPAEPPAALEEMRPRTVALGHSGLAPGSEENSAPSPRRDDDEWETPTATFLMGVVLTSVCCWILLKLMRRAQPAYEYQESAAPPRAMEAPISKDRFAALAPKGSSRYRVTKSSARSGRRRIRAHSPHLVGTEGLAAGAKFVLSTPVISIGRDGDNEIVLAETKVSRRHARIEHGQSGAVMLIDEASANGVFVNGMRVEKAVLHQGDEIKIGGSFFRYEE